MNRDAQEAITNPNPTPRQQFIKEVAEHLYEDNPLETRPNRDTIWLYLVAYIVDSEEWPFKPHERKSMVLLVNAIEDVWDYLARGTV